MNTLAIKERISGNRALRDASITKRRNVIDWSKNLSGQTTKDKYDFHWIWTSNDKRYRVGFGKYGKEYYLQTLKRTDGSIGNNQHDMWTIVEKDGSIVEFDPSFDHVFTFFQYVQQQCGNDILNILGCIMIRNAYMLDHKEIDGNYYYLPDYSVIKPFVEALPIYEGISTEAYLHYIDAIAQNEDVKYDTLGHDIKTGTGRTNNLLTYAHIIAVLLGKASLSKLCASFARPPVGVAPIRLGDIATIFPLLEVVE